MATTRIHAPRRRGRPPAADQTEARRLIAAALEESPASLRSLARRIGLTSHAALSRWLAGKQKISAESILRLARLLGIEGRPMEALARGLLPHELAKEAAAPHATPSAAAPPEGADGPTRVSEVRFFFHPKTPLVYETLKIRGASNLRELAAAFHPELRLTRDEVATCVRALEELGLLRLVGDRWQVIDPRRDVVVPSRHTTEAGRRVVQDALGTHARFVGLTAESRLMRSIVTTVRAPPGESPLMQLAPRIVAFQDDILSLQAPGDDTVVNVFVSAVRVTTPDRRPQGSSQ